MLIHARKLSQGAKSQHVGADCAQADGHCLYRAVENQLARNGDAGPIAGGYWGLRAQAAQRMRAHPDDYMPFISQVAPRIFALCSVRDSFRQESIAVTSCKHVIQRLQGQNRTLKDVGRQMAIHRKAAEEHSANLLNAWLWTA
jgi:hypothetical protein